MTAATFERLLPDLRGAYALEFPEVDLGIAFGRLREDLLAAWKAETVAAGSEIFIVGELEKVWPALIEKAYEPVKDFEPLLAKLDLATEPAAMTVDLLGVAGRERDEVCHTQVIASLLDPSVEGFGDLGVHLLRALLDALGIDIEAWPAELLRKARVSAEEEQSVRGRTIRLDLIVRVGEDLLVVIENKVDARDGANQLDDYATWATSESANEKLLVYLTPNGAEPSKVKGKHAWETLSYSKLAVAWRRVLARSRSGDPLVETLRLYLATINQHVWGVNLSRGLGPSEKLPLMDYLRAASGE